MSGLLRLLQFLTYPFLALSMLILSNGFGFGAAFIADFTIANQTSRVITVIPIGTVGIEGRRYPLPITISSYLNLPALGGRALRLMPGEEVAISYDMDDINFSEIVVKDDRAKVVQLITDPQPTTRQYHGPTQQRYIVDDLARLQAPPATVLNAAQQAVNSNRGTYLLYGLLIGPWLAFGVLALALRQSNSVTTSVSDRSAGTEPELPLDSQA